MVVLDRDRHAGQRAIDLAGRVGGGQGLLAHHDAEGVELRVESFDAGHEELDEFARLHFAPAYQLGERGGTCKSEFVGGRVHLQRRYLEVFTCASPRWP